jgi:DNA-binding Xre family transcriptional regulator
MTITLIELKEKVAQNYDVCLICDELEIEPEELLEFFGERLWAKRERFEEYHEE